MRAVHVPVSSQGFGVSSHALSTYNICANKNAEEKVVPYGLS